MSAPLTEAERGDLLDLARAAIRETLFHDGSLAAVRGRIETTPPLVEPRGAFVTLKVPGPDGAVLRGCIGTLAARGPLFETVASYAVEAAFHDPRFPPVNAEELPSLTIAVSALTPVTPIASEREIEIGRHGVVLEKDMFRSVFLPEVAEEQGWELAELLEHLALKAGLPRSAWRGARFAVFESERFEETTFA